VAAAQEAEAAELTALSTAAGRGRLPGLRLLTLSGLLSWVLSHADCLPKVAH